MKRRDLMFVTAGLELTGGGRAAAGRLLAASCAAYAAERGSEFSLLSLSGLEEFAGDERARGFAGRQGALAAAAWQRQIAERRRLAVVYDLLGPARVQNWLPAALRAPYAVILYGIEVWRPLGAARRKALRQAALRLAISAHTRDAALAANGANGANGANDDRGEIGPIDVLPLCLEKRPPAGNVDGDVLARAGENYILIVGRMAATERYKGHDELFGALAALLAESPPQPEPRLVVAGDGDDRPRLEERARQLGLGGHVCFTGFASEATLAELYRRCAVFAMPSLGEGFGLVYLEAMRAGKPCVALRRTAAAEIIDDGVTGILVDRDAPAQLAAALGRLLADGAAAANLGAAGRRRFEQDFTPQGFRRHLWPFLDRLTGAPQAGSPLTGSPPAG